VGPGCVRCPDDGRGRVRSNSFDIMSQKIEESELLSELCRLREKLDKPPTSHDMKEHGEYSPTPYSTRYGSWVEALLEAGITPSEKQRKMSSYLREFSKEEIIEGLKDIYNQNGKVTKDLTDDCADFSHTTVQIHFDSFNSALEDAGIPKTHEIGISERVECDGCGSLFTVAPWELKRDEYHFCCESCSHKPILKESCAVCDSLVDVSVARSKHPDKIYCSKECSKLVKNEKVPCENCSKSVFITKRHKHSIGGFCDHDCYGEWLSENRTGEDCPNYNGGSEHIPYGNNWRAQREKALNRDDYQCVRCGKSEKEHLSEFGTSLHVHHLKPRERFYNSPDRTLEDADKLDNLTTLCAPCHRKWEGIPLRPQ